MVGHIVGTHGLKGTLKVRPLTDFPQRFAPGASLFIEGKEFEIAHEAWHKAQLRLTLVGIATIDQAETFVGKSLTVPEDSPLEMDEDEYFTDELVGCQAYDQFGTLIGEIEDVFPTPAHDVIVIDDAMIPAVHEFVISVDLEKNEVRLSLIPGMWPKDKEPK